MDRLFREFGRAVNDGNGNALAALLAPVAPADDPHRLQNIWNGAGHHDAKAVIKRKIQNNSDALVHSEVQGWTEVYYAYWKALGQILLVQDEQNGRGPVVGRGHFPNQEDAGTLGEKQYGEPAGLFANKHSRRGRGSMRPGRT